MCGTSAGRKRLTLAEPITVEEWLAELQRLGSEVGDDSGALSMGEMCDLFGRGIVWVRRRLRAAIKAGLVEATRKRVLAMDGRTLEVGAYRLVKRSGTRKGRGGV